MSTAITPPLPIDVAQALIDATADVASQYEEVAALAKATSQVITVHDATSEAQAAEFVRQTEAYLSKVDAERLRFTKPLNDAKRAIDANFADALKPLRAAIKAARDSMGAYRARLAEQAQAERERARLAATVQAHAEVREALTQAETLTQAPVAEKVGYVTSWVPTVVDADAVPRAYCSPDIAKLSAAVGAEPPTIPGIKWTAVSTPRIRK